MTEHSAVNRQNWDVNLYDQSFGFISEFGAGLVELLAPNSGECIIDLGCGIGQLSAQIAAKGCDVIGIDVDAEMIATARQKYPDIQFICAAGENFAVDKPADAVFSNAALHWMKQPDRVIAGVWRSLKKPGRFVGEFGGHGNVAHLHRALLDAASDRGIARDEIDPWYFPTPDEYGGRLEAAGFKVESIALIDRPTPLPTGVAGWIESVAHPFLAAVAPDARADLISEVEDRVRTFLCKDGAWFADYVRLRFRVHKPG